MHVQAEGFTVGEVIRISCEPVDVRVSAVTAARVFLEWPWRNVDAESGCRWDGTVGFPRDSGDWDWRNTPWRLEPEPAFLDVGDSCLLGIPPTDVRVVAIEQHEPPADFGWTPRPSWVLGLCPVSDLGEEDAGYVVYVNSGEPMCMERLG
jgi:hypothetical protein